MPDDPFYEEGGIFYSLPYIDPQTGQGVITPHWDARTGQPFGDFIVPPFEDTPTSSRTPTATTNYEEPWYVDTINRAIERAAQVATLEVAGYPPYPTFPAPTPQTTPLPQGQAQQQVGAQPNRDSVTFSNTTLMLLVGGFLLFTLGKRGR
jgi:hypothetical protein